MTRKRATGPALVVALCLFGAFACGRTRPGGAPAPASSASTASAAVPPPSIAAPSESAPPAPSGELASALVTPTRACRAITVKGKVTEEGGAVVKSGDALERPTWLVLEKGSSLAVKHAETSRELVFHGPAHLVACERGEERFLVTEGRVETVTWAGARPGAEVLIATPFGVVTYGDAKLDVHVDRKGLTLAATSGSAWVAVPRTGSDPEERKVQSGGRTDVPGPVLEVKTLVQDCETRAEASEALARAVLDTTSTAPLGERAAAHARARKAARLECGIAAASLGTVENGPDRARLAEAVARAESRYRSVPSLRPR
ncbi:MAG TPA: hypothetical protein VHE30_25060 [Polyangiaceae bacterium]|nr:hypothetical protein [Polyangiaceae bacterium]